MKRLICFLVVFSIFLGAQDYDKMTYEEIQNVIQKILDNEDFDVDVYVSDETSAVKNDEVVMLPIWGFVVSMNEKYQGTELSYLIVLSAGIVGEITSKTSWKSDKLLLVYSKKIPRSPNYDRLSVTIKTSDCRAALTIKEAREREKFILNCAEIRK